MGNLSRVLLRSWGSHWHASLRWSAHDLLVVSYLTFLDGAPKWYEEIEGSSAQPGIEDKYQYYWRSTSCFQVALSIQPLLVGVIFLGSLWSCGSLLIKGDPKFLEWLICAFRRCPWKLLPYLLVLLYHDKEGLVGRYFFIVDGIYFVFSSLLLLFRVGEFKIGVNEKNEVILALSSFGLLTHHIT